MPDAPVATDRLAALEYRYERIEESWSIRHDDVREMPPCKPEVRNPMHLVWRNHRHR